MSLDDFGVVIGLMVLGPAILAVVALLWPEPVTFASDDHHE